ncbi:hypothetical protein [Aestuariivirga sp.]|uniref:hypothetical protein n=1 Tax=Aestuariivirga sp. TaxID=2650926 RepID=UPI0039E2F6F4
MIVRRLLTIACLMFSLFAVAQAAGAATQAPLSRVLLVQGTKCGTACPRWIYVTGPISFDTQNSLRLILSRIGWTKPPVVFNSSGGDMDAAMVIGRMLRDQNLISIAAPVKFSGCDPSAAADCRDHDTQDNPYRGQVMDKGALCSGSCLLALAGGETRLAGRGAFTLPSLADPAFGQSASASPEKHRVALFGYLVSMGLPGQILDRVTAGKAGALTSAELSSLAIITGKAVPSSRLSPAVCKAKDKPSYCIAGPAKPAKPAVEATPDYMQPMIATIVRSSEKGCEPTCPEWIQLEGEIRPQSPAVFRKALAKAAKLQLPVLVRSPGGDVRAAMEIGRLIRQRKLDVAVGWTYYDGCNPRDQACVLPKPQQGVYRGTVYSMQAFCESACPLILASGQRRLAGYPSSVGVHQILTTWHQERIFYRVQYRIVNGKKKEVSRTIVSRKPTKSYTTTGFYKGLRKELTVYLTGMGVSTQLLDDMELAPPSSIHELPIARRTELKLATGFESAAELTSNKICAAAPPAANCIAAQ